MQILSEAADVTVVLREGADAGPALGGARLALIGCCGVPIEQACRPGPVVKSFVPERKAVAAYAKLAKKFRALYPALREFFHDA